MRNTLTEAQIQLATLIGEERFARRRKAGSVHKYNRNQSEHTVKKEIEAIGAEIAVGNVIGRSWKDSDSPDHAGDVGRGVQVRFTSYGSGRLMLHPEDNDAHAYFLVTGAFPNFDVKGFIMGADGKREGKWGSLVPGRPAFLIEQTMLRPVLNRPRCPERETTPAAPTKPEPKISEGDTRKRAILERLQNAR